MKTLKGQNFVHDNNYILFPDGAIQNEIEGTQEGTPVVREVYNDFLMNMYAYLRERKIVPNQQEDNANNGYQFINALKRNVNELNDVEKILSINGSTWNLNIDFTLIPSKYFVFARAGEDYSPAIQFLRGTDGVQYPFAPADFKIGDEILLILDQSSIRTYNLTKSSSSQQSDNFTVFGNPLSYLSNSQKIWYQKDEELYSSFPETHNIKSLIEEYFPNDIEIRSCVLFQGKIVVLAFDIQSNENLFFTFTENWIPKALIPDILINQTGADVNSLMFTDGDLLYVTNNAGNEAADNKLSLFNVEFDQEKILHHANFILENSFVKTTNSVVHNQGIITFYQNSLKKYSFAGAVDDLGTFNNFAGSLFKIDQDVYYTDGKNATKWNI